MADITLIIPNRTHAFPINIKGVVTSNENSGTDILAFVGTQKAQPVDVIDGPLQFTLSVSASNMIAGEITKDEQNKKFVMGEIVGSSIGIDSDLVSVSDINSENAADFKNVPSTKGQLEFTATISDAEGVLHTKTQTCDYVKARSLFSTDTNFIEVGTTLRASTESIMDPEGIKQITSFNWYRSNTEIEGATSNTYVVTNEDVNREISAVLKYVDGKDNSKEVIAIQNVFVVNSAPINFPLITGIPESGQTLEADTSFIYDRNEIATDFAFTWSLDGVITAVTSSQFSIAQGDTDAGKVLYVTASYTDGAGAENSLVSPPVTVRDSAAGDTVVMTGTPKLGQTIQAQIQTSDGSTPTILEYEWRRGGRLVEGQNSSTYKIKRADINSFLTATIKYDTGSGVPKYKTSGVVSFENSTVSGTPILTKILDDGTSTTDLANGGSVGEELRIDVSSITDPDDIKDFYYSFDDLTDADLLRDKVSLNTRISHNTITVKRSSGNQSFVETSDEIVYQEAVEVQSIYLDNSLGNSGDVIYVQYRDQNNSWQNALQIDGKSSRYHLLDENISSTNWRLSFIVTSTDNTASSYSFEAQWALESPSILSTRRFLYEWQREVNGVTESIVGARKQNYLISQADLNSTINAKVFFQDSAGNLNTLESNTIEVLNFAPSGRVRLEGTAKVGNVLTIAHNLTDRDNITVENPDGNVIAIDSYRWFLDGVAIDGATSQSLVLTSDMQTKRVSAELTYTDALNAEHTVKTKISKRVNASPTGGVKIFGTPKVGKKLSINTSNLEDLNQFNQLFYQWFLIDGDSESAISNASSQDYTVKITDIGKSIRANVYYTDNDGFQETISTNTTSIQDSVTTGEPSIDGIPLAGNTVTANISNISDDNGIAGYEYQWRIDEENVAGATFNSFTITADENGQYGNYLDVAVTVTDNAQNKKTLYSDPVRIALAANTVGSDGGTVTGSNVSITIQAGSLQEDTVIYVYETTTGSSPQLPEGSTLVGTAWAFTPHGTTFNQPVTIQFEVPENTNLILRADDEDDNTFEIVENATVSNNTATLESSTFSVYIGSVFTPAVITGTPEQNNYLTASVTGDVTDVSFQWKRNGSNILNAQDSTYLVKQEDVGQMLTVAATFTDVNGNSTTKTSAETEILNTPAQGEVRINGSRRVGITLESEIVSVTDANTAGSDYSYQWYRNNSEILGATSANYEVTEDDFLKDLLVKVTFTDGAGNAETIISEEIFVSKKGSVFFNSNSRKQGDTLSINTSTINDFYSIFNRNFSWYLDNEVAYSGRNLTNRTLTTADSGKTLKAEFSYTDGRGTKEVLSTDERFIYTISDTITPAGGIISANGISINVPAGAVTSDTDILVYVVPYTGSQLPIGTLSDEVAYAFTPLDLVFDQPITITLPKPNDEYDMVLYGTSNSVDEFLMTEDDFLTIDNTNQITIQTDNFGVFMSAILYVRVDILGTPEQGQVLDTLFTGEVFSYTYQWYRGDTPIEGETGTTYTVTLQDVDKEIKVIGTYLLESGSAPETVESEPVLIINSQPEVDTSAIVSGEDRVGEILTADPSGITDANNPDGLSGFLYQWKVEGQDIGGATSETLTIQPEHFNKNITVEITYVDATGLLESVTSDNLYITRIPPTGYVEVIGTPEVDEYLEVDTDNLVDLNGIGEFSYQWHADGVDLAGEISASLLVTPAMEDKAISATLTYTDGVGEVETVTTRNAPVIDADPVGNVVIDYTILEVAQTLVANTNAISDANSPGGVTGYTYQWKSNGSPISGATSKNYVVANQFCNTDITVTVTYTDGDGYIETLTSDAVTIVNSPVQGRPTVSGTPGVSETLTINTDGLISDVNVIGALNYKWFADGEEIAGATEKTWVVAANSYVGKNITGQVYYTDEAGNAEEVVTSNGLVIQNSPPVNKPIIHGTLQVGQTLTVDPSEIEDFNIINSDFSYQWYANNVAIADATGSSYVVQVDDINKNISVDASYTDEGNTFETVRSNNYKIINTPGTATVLITNTGLEQGDILSSSVTSQDDNIRVSDYSYQWKRDGVAIRNANESTYMLGRNDLNKEITLQASFTDTGGFVETFQSENSASMIVASPTGEIHILGSNKVGESVEADVSEIQDISGIRPEREVLNYWLYLNGTRTHSFTEGMVTKIIGNPAGREYGRFLDIQLYASSSSGWGWVNVNNLQHNLNRTITSTNKIGYYFVMEFNHPIRARQIHYRQEKNVRMQVFIESTKSQEAYTYQWYRDGDMITGSTEKTHTNTFDDLYKTLTVDVSYTDYYGNVKHPNNTASFDIVNSPPEGTVLIHGTRNVGESLYFTHNVVDRDNITVDNPTGLVTFSSYQWYQSDFEDGELTPIVGAVSASLLLTSDLQAKWIALDATYVDIEGDDDTIHASNRLPVKSTPTGNAIITSADLQLGRQVFLDTSTIADQNDLGEFSYQWYRTEGTGSIAISGAIQTHYSFQPADLGEDIFVTVSYVDGDGDPELLTSNTLGPVVQTSGSVGTITIDSFSEINGEITSDVENIFAMNNFETVAPVVAYNFHSDTRDVSPNGLHLAGTNYAFDADGGLDLSHSTSAYLRTSGPTPVLNNETHTVAFRVKRKGTASQWTKIFTFGSSATYGNPEVWLTNNNSKKLTIDWKQVGTDSGADWLITPDLEQDVWYDIMFVKQGNVGRLYVDGVLIQTNNSLPNPSDRADSRIEFGYRDSTYVAAPVIIKDFQIFDFAVDDYTSATNYPFYTEPTLSYQWKADGNLIAGETNATLQLTGGNNDLGKDITLEVSLTDALGNATTLESNASVVVGSELVQVERFLLEDGSEMLQEDGSSFLSETVTDDISLPLSLDGDLIDLNTVLALNGESATDLSNKANSIYFNGNTAISTIEKKFGNSSYYFDGNGDFLSVGYSDSWNLSDKDFTIDFWIRPEDMADTYQGIFAQNDFQFIAMQFNEGSANGKMTIWIDKTGGSGWEFARVSNTTFANNQWYHIALVRKGDNIKLFVDGQQDWSETFTGAIYTNPSVPLWLGRSQLSTRFFKGYIDDFRIIKGVALYSENFSVATSSSIVDQRTVVGSVLSVDVSNVVDPNGLANVEYQWYANNAAIAGATSSSYTITADETNKDIRVKAVFEDGMGRKSARLSDEITVQNTPITGTVQVSSTGEYKVGNALLATSIDISDDNGIMSVVPTYQWYRNNSPISGEVGRSYIIKNADVGAQLHVVASIVDNYFNIETITSDAVSIVDSTGIGSTTINGLPKVGATLAIDTSGLSDPNGITSFSYQWRRGVNDLSGETNQTYTVTPSDYGQDITAVVTYIDGAGNITTLSNLPVIHIVRAAALGSVTITGTAEVLSTLTATDTITDQDLMGPKNYQWYLNGSAISGATNSTFEIPRGYEGQDIHVVLSYVETLEDGSNDVETMVSNIVEINSKPYGNVYIIGTAKKGQSLSIDMGEVIDTNIIDNATKTYQWQREVSNGVFQNISGATSSTYVPVNDDVENKIRVVVSYTDEAGFNENINSVPVLVENSLPTGVISFTGTRKTGNTIAATISNISDANGIATIPEYQWKLNGEILVGETGNSYTIISDDVGKELSLQLTYTDGVGTVEVEEQSAGIIEDSVTTGQVDITGDFVLNGTVTADISSIADTDGIDTISYQWKALDVEIPGATSQTYVLNDSDMRRFNISVEVSVLDVNGTIKTFSKKKWFDEGAMVATYKWYHFDDLNHILNFQADDQLVTNNLQLHLDANSSNNINGAVWNDLTSNAHNVSIKNDYASTTGNAEHSTIRMSNGDIATESYRDINRTINIPEGSVVSGKVTVNLDVFEDYYRQYRSRYCSSSSYNYCCGHYAWGYPGPRWHFTCGNYCYVCNSYGYGSWEITNDPGREYNTSQMEFYLVSPSGKEYLIVSGNFSRNSTFEVDADDALAKGQWKIRAKATNSIWNWEDYYTYSNSQGHYYYRRYIDTSISFEYETIDGTSATYSEQGVLGGFDQQQGSFEGLITVEDNKAVKTLEQITLETFVYRENWSKSPNYDEYLAHKDKYELYLDQSNDLTFRVNDSRVNRVNLDRFGLNGWNHIVATYDGVSFKFFINGNLIDATNPINARQSIDFGDSDDLYIASKGDLFSRWSGKISSFKFYDRAITRKEVLSNYNYELARNGLTEKTFSLQSQDNYLVTNGKVGSYDTSVSTEHTKELRGYFKPLQSGDHTFYVYGADKGYFWVGDKAKERISTSNADIETTNSGEFTYTIYLEADIAYPIRFISGNSYEDNVTSTSRLSVSGPGLNGKMTNLQNYLFGGDAAWTYWDTAVAKVTYMVEDFDSQWDDISAYDFTGFTDYQTIISTFGLNVNRTLSEPYRWDALPKPEFSDNIETSLEESFEDTSWTGPNRFDWTGVENPEQIASQFGINGYTSFGDNEERFKWTDAPTATFSGDSLVEETFEDDSWTGYTRVDWTGVDPADYRSGIQGYWEGTHDWTSEPQPEFLQDTFVFSEEFEDTSWTGYTRFDWTGTENPSSFVSGKGFAAHWEGQFKWSERAQTSFSEKSLLLEESFEEDWTI